MFSEEERKTLQDILERHEITLHTHKQDDEIVVEAEFYSDLGENFIATFFYDGTAKSFAEGAESYCNDFDPYEHASMYISMNPMERKRMMVPDSNEALMKDALKIKKKLKRLSRELRNAFCKKVKGRRGKQ